jgi:hypothetical protein
LGVAEQQMELALVPAPRLVPVLAVEQASAQARLQERPWRARLGAASPP